jgi:predicted nucleotidyltransferase
LKNISKYVIIFSSEVNFNFIGIFLYKIWSEEMNYRDTLNKFIDDMNYLKNDEVEGIVFYGSFHTGTHNEFSDIDLMILYDDDSDINQIKGFKTVNGIQVEYYERPVSKLYERANSDYMKCEDSLLSIVGYGEIIFDRNGKIKELRDYVLEKYQRPLPGYIKQEALYEIAACKKSVLACEELRVQNDPYFDNYYFITVEKIRVFYHKLKGFSNLSQTKVYKLYTNEHLREVQHKKVPEKEFIDLFIKAIDNNTSKEEKIKRVTDFFKYATREFDIDYDNLRIDLGKKRY